MNQEVFNFFAETHNLHLTESEYADIVDMVAKDKQSEIDLLNERLNEARQEIAELKVSVERFKQALLS